MRSKNPVQAKSTPDILGILPPHFEMVKNTSSNGYKYTNLLYGVEIDEANERLKTIYDSLHLGTIDLADTSTIYEASLSGTPNSNGLLNSDGIRIKITSEDEFYNGEPTRIIYKESFPVYSGTESILGANYFRQGSRGSGYVLLSYDVDEGESYIAGSGSALKCYYDNVGESGTTSGIWAGIQIQDYDNAGSDEVIVPISQNVLSGRYPYFREILVSGVVYNIPYYEPYRGWIFNYEGTPTAVNDYFQDYYFNDEGEKTFYRTYMNNPNGSGVYNKQHFALRHTPVSGTLKVYDMDILDISGNATEIHASGTNIYYLAYSGMQDGTEGGYEPVYRGYDQFVPSGRGFNYIEGEEAALLATTTWDYQREGSHLDDESRIWIEPTSGDITNLISITNPQSRYILEYKWKEFKKAAYVSSFDATRYLSLDTTQPLYSIENLSGNVYDLDYRFTKNPNYITVAGGVSSDERAQILTFNGWTVRPKSRIHQVELNVPIVYTQSTPLTKFHVGYEFEPIGYTEDLIPQKTPLRTYELNCPFDNPTPTGAVTEDDLAGNSNNCVYNVSGSNKFYRVPYDSWYGKKIIYVGGGSKFTVDMTGKSFLKNNTFFKFGFKPLKPQAMTLLEMYDTTASGYIIVSLDEQGVLSTEINGYNFIARSPIVMDNSPKEVIVRYYPDDLYPLVPIVEMFTKDQKYNFDVQRLFRQTLTYDTVSSSYLHLYKNCTVDVDKFQIYYEAF